MNGPTGATVLLVDDSEIVCETVRLSLESVGIDVVTLSSPFGFIKTVRETQPKLILLDIGLGSVNGTKLVALGRKHAPASSPILLYSGREQAQLEEDTASSGADGYISKSTRGGALIDTVQQWLSKSEG